MQTIQFTLGAVFLLLGIALSIGLHELGHLLPAKLFGVHVSKFMIGFGPTLWSKSFRGTEYGLKLLPLGGFVALHQMLPPERTTAPDAAGESGLGQTGAVVAGPQEKPPAAGAGRAATITGAAASSAAASSAVKNSAVKNSAAVTTTAQPPATAAFWRLSWWRKVIVMAGGPCVNLALGLLLLTVLLVGIGIPQHTTSVANVLPCLPSSTSVPANDSAVCDGAAVSPAAQAGIATGDKLLAINGETLTSWQQAREIFGANAGVTLQLTLQRGESTHTVAITPQPATRIQTDEHGTARTDATGNYLTETAGIVGISPATARTQLPLRAVPAHAAAQLEAVGALLAQLPARLSGVWEAAFHGADRDTNGPISVVGVTRIAGEISSHEDLTGTDKAASLIGLLAGLNFALFVFNMLPLLPLDGGHIAGALYEAAKRRLWRALGKPDPQPFNIAKMWPLTVIVIAVFGAISLLVMYADIVQPITVGR